MKTKVSRPSSKQIPAKVKPDGRETDGRTVTMSTDLLDLFAEIIAHDLVKSLNNTGGEENR
jgi:hypothetical protein